MKLTFQTVANSSAVCGEVEAPVAGTDAWLVDVVAHLVRLYVDEVVGTEARDTLTLSQEKKTILFDVKKVGVFL